MKPGILPGVIVLAGIGVVGICVAVGQSEGEGGEKKPVQTLPPLVAWEEPAEAPQDYQNLQLLQHLHGAEIERLMGFFAETMGHKCKFCHNIRNYALDEKEPKQEGRKMIELVQHLNREWFHAERITCYTCHDATTEVLILPEGVADLPELVAGEKARQLPEDYVNVQRLQHLTEEEYDRVMDFFVASLGQTSCRFCHNIRDYASDEKEEKVRAREMIAMVQDVNPRNWSEKRITCYTCHAGEEHPRRFPEGWKGAPLPGKDMHEHEHERGQGHEEAVPSKEFEPGDD